MLPETRYARSGEVHIAYQVIGNGPFDLVWVPGFISHVDHVWDEPRWAGFMERLASFARLICFDKRGTGLSDRVTAIPTLEERMDDARVVMDAVGSKRAAFLGISEGGPMSLLFAATHPDRTLALMLYGSYGLFSTAVMSPDKLASFLEEVERSWGSGALVPGFAPSLAQDRAFRNWWARFERLGASPSDVKTLMRMNSEIDIRGVLPVIHVPTLIMHRTDDPRVNVEASRYLATHIAGARYVELSGSDHLFCAGDSQRILDEIEEFLTGSRSHSEMERCLATVLITDIVGSTERVCSLGDREWRHLLVRHDSSVRREIARFRGKEIRTTGDGFIATFDGPARAVRCAEAVRQTVRDLGLEVRAGLHTGEIEILPNDIGGIAVHVAARVAQLAAPGEILTSSVLRDLVAGSGLSFEDRGVHALKGLAEGVRIFAAR
ncbi:adenylate/guanylate cyclase domain-containing protein [Bradyrhizobium arachidis]|uniref:Alpha/beta fold hydrolase n=1 Tax=Bradyrhizobium arachidis TaxID=858423 RepID=A0AAE7NR04_9BRAD|nr:adenylate/guanylate cyclase domain-containing protein [Bradyrhizobium arachidis]QOZ68806.1 alpha/beta fold hydrolase [Bradyrhizobium arachidis]SFV18733.1 Adenylate cyclase, class 3 [Bradyrhizobium arachidis]